MRTLIIGGTGCGGRALAVALAAAGHPVRVLSRGRTLAPPLPPGADAVQVDRCDPTALGAALRDFAPECVIDQIAYARADVEGLYAGLPAGVRRVFTVSSAVVYAGERGGLAGRCDTAHREDDPLAADASDFARAKAEADTAAREDPRGVVLRLGLLFGPGQAPLTPLGRAPDLADRLSRGEALAVPADDVPRLQPLYAGDFAALVVALLAHDGPLPAALNVTGDDRLGWGEWLGAWAAAWGLPPPRLLPCSPAALTQRAPPHLARFLPAMLAPPMVDATRLRTLLPAWRPTPTRAAVAATVAASG